MLELRPNCEGCNKALPPDAEDACICSYECTFCRQCVQKVLENVCPNCGGGFAPRPIRPAHEHRQGVSLDHQPASTEPVRTKYTEQEIRQFSAKLKHISPLHR